MILRFVAVSLASISFAFPSYADEAITANNFASLLGNAPTEQTIQTVFQSNPEQVLDILSLLLQSEGIDQQFVLTEALTAAPEQAQAIAQVARDAGVSSETITTSALLADVDPTEVAEATAAGPASAIAPPAAPAVGSNGGGGLAVVSPN